MGRTPTGDISVDAWQAIAANTVVKGAELAVNPNDATILYIAAALSSTTAQANGMDIRVQASPMSADNDLWVDICSFVGPIGTANAPTVSDNPLSAGATTINVSAGTNFIKPLGTDNGWRFLKDATVANSEIWFQTAVSTNALTALEGVKRQHAQTTSVCYNKVETFTCYIPDGYYRVRVVYNNCKDASGSENHVRCMATKVVRT
jgi:hypothetical protein